MQALCDALSCRYLGNAVLELAAEGKEALFAFEEAIGYLNGHEIRDKDGVGSICSNYSREFADINVHSGHRPRLLLRNGRHAEATRQDIVATARHAVRPLRFLHNIKFILHLPRLGQD